MGIIGKQLNFEKPKLNPKKWKQNWERIQSSSSPEELHGRQAEPRTRGSLGLMVRISDGRCCDREGSYKLQGKGVKMFREGRAEANLGFTAEGRAWEVWAVAIWVWRGARSQGWDLCDLGLSMKGWAREQGAIADISLAMNGRAREKEPLWTGFGLAREGRTSLFFSLWFSFCFAGHIVY